MITQARAQPVTWTTESRSPMQTVVLSTGPPDGSGKRPQSEARSARSARASQRCAGHARGTGGLTANTSSAPSETGSLRAAFRRDNSGRSTTAPRLLAGPCLTSGGYLRRRVSGARLRGGAALRAGPSSLREDGLPCGPRPLHSPAALRGRLPFGAFARLASRLAHGSRSQAPGRNRPGACCARGRP